MPNLIDYLEQVKELTFDQEPLNILDKVCINEIGYLIYDKWFTASDLQNLLNLHDYARIKT
ncbi:hypothetical protein [Streptococcus thermophilus]|uniref:hypothetical protein n=1 Tax=Streptococcus thermophilus TaxID=1308 RepID=UPI0022FF3D31|nr:hypothetical protein [Streptococcus thermophilus]MDA5503783.1 hypothetical protein [Streptococcus thermophilus]